MPELCREIAKHPDHSLGEPTLSELEQWFTSLCQEASPQFKLLFMIDGIDELEGDYTDLVQTILSVESVHVKFLVASRPIPACADAFAAMPKLQLQDLTTDDIRHYATEILSSRLQLRGGPRARTGSC